VGAPAPLDGAEPDDAETEEADALEEDHEGEPEDDGEELR
jgi:hypothetical protein